MTIMTKDELKIIYMATADFALPALQRLVEHRYRIVAVVTMPDKPAGRGMKLQSSKIKQYALEQGIEVLQPVKLRDEAFGRRLRELEPDLGIVVAFRMLPEEVWRLPRLGTINLHGSLLPRYRGAAPIHWAVINGDTETGVSTFLLKHEIDTGDVLLQASTPISAEDTTGSVHDRLMMIGAELLEETVTLFLNGRELTPHCRPQEASGVTHAPKLTKDNTRIDWTRSNHELYNFVRGLNPYPTAWADLLLPKQTEPSMVKIHAVTPIALEERHQGLPAGSVILHERKALEVVCGSASALRIEQLQLPGKKSMRALDFINGLH